MALVRDADRILDAAEIGVVMMLFVIGLELSPSRLRVMRKPVFGTGGLQVLLTALALGGIASLPNTTGKPRWSSAWAWHCPRPRSACNCCPSARS